MDKKLKAKWVKALISGDYPQGTGFLYCTDGYCCLGVLGDQCGLSKNDMQGTGYLSPKILDKKIQRPLAVMNDSGIPFPVIAGFIQENL